MAIPYSPKLRLAPLWPALAALALAALLARGLIPGAIADQAAQELAQFLRLLEPTLPRPAANGPVPDLELQRAVAALAARTDFRITLIRLDGAVLADSALDDDALRSVENHRARAEVAAAIARGEGTAVRESVTTGIETAYAARLATGVAGQSFVARLALPIRSLATYRSHLLRMLAIAALGAIGVAVVVSWWLSRSLFDPLSRLIAAAGRIGDGDYRVAVPVPDETELAALGRALERIAREAERQLAAAQAERDHLRATVGSMGEGVLVVDAGARPLLANPAFHDLFGLPPSAPAASLLELAREPRVADLMAEVLVTAAPRAIELERTDTSSPLARRLALFGTPLSVGGGAVLVARDITDTEKLHQMRKEFVANVSHELKTPLAAIRGYAETLVDGAVEERATALRFSTRILEQCRRLGELLDDLLTLSRLEGTEALRATERVDLRELAEEAFELARAHAAAKPVTLELEPAPPSNRTLAVDGDWEGLLRLLSNLLDNAIKYNHPGGSVRVRLSEIEGQALIEVEDSGIGIPAAQRGRIFERFYRVDKGRAREEGGTGLGLAIVKHVAQAHRGRVEVESELGSGSTFRVYLPRAGGI